MNVALQARELTLPPRLQAMSLNFDAGKCSHVLGPNGAGKSTLLQLLAGVLTAQSGNVVWHNGPLNAQSLTELAVFRGYLGQHADTPFALPVSEFVQFYAAPGLFVKALPSVLAELLDVNHLLDRTLNSLSGGELQRINLLRVLLQVWPAAQNGQALIILDEPLQGLDVRHQYALMALTRQLASQGNTLILSSHDIQLSANYSDNVVLLKDGALVAQGTPDEVVSEFNLNLTFDCHFAVKNSQNYRQILVCDPIV